MSLKDIFIEYFAPSFLIGVFTGMLIMAFISGKIINSQNDFMIKSGVAKFETDQLTGKSRFVYITNFTNVKN